jgi:hypothetical protein
MFMICSFDGKDGDANAITKNIENEEFDIGLGKAFENVLVIVVSHVLENSKG